MSLEIAKIPEALSSGGSSIGLFIPVGYAQATPFTLHITIWSSVGIRISMITAAFIFQAGLNSLLLKLGACACTDSARHTEINFSACGHRFSVTLAHSKWCEGLGQGEVTRSAVWKRLAGWAGGRANPWMSWRQTSRDSVKLQTSLSRSLSLSLSHFEP